MGMMSNISVEQSGGVDEKKGELDSITISPNPASDHTQLRFPSLEKETILIISDDRGNILLKMILQARAEDHKLSVSNFPNGSYSISLGNKQAHLVVKR